jgi:hypothetical protein
MGGGGAADLRPEVEDDPDLRAPPVSGWPKKKKGKVAVWAGGREELGHPRLQRASAEGKGAGSPGWFAG